MLDLSKHIANPLSDAAIATHRLAALARGLPDISTLPRPANPRLAIVGAGPSVARHVNALRNWKGAVWAINDAALWCERNKIRCSLFSIDPMPTFDPAIGKEVARAVLATRCHGRLFDLLRDAQVVTFDLPSEELGPGSSPSACIVATRLAGYRDITFFGCEGSYAHRHAYVYGHWDEIDKKNVLVRVAGKTFLTNFAYLSASLAIAWTIKFNPKHVHEKSGGLLAALVKDYDYELTGICPAIAAPTTPPAMLDAYKNYTAACAATEHA